MADTETEIFDVYIWLKGGDKKSTIRNQIGHSLTAERAVELARSYSHPARPANLLGIIRRIAIVAADDDSTVFMWERDKGVTFPPGVYLQ